MFLISLNREQENSYCVQNWFQNFVCFSPFISEEAADACLSSALPRGIAISCTASFRWWLSLPILQVGNDPSSHRYGSQGHKVWMLRSLRSIPVGVILCFLRMSPSSVESDLGRAWYPQSSSVSPRQKSHLLQSKNVSWFVPWLEVGITAKRAKTRNTYIIHKAMSVPQAIQIVCNQAQEELAPALRSVHTNPTFQSQACKYSLRVWFPWGT